MYIVERDQPVMVQNIEVVRLDRPMLMTTASWMTTMPSRTILRPRLIPMAMVCRTIGMKVSMTS